ncbi:hypothetical protein LGH70_05190 [Hymenobacter sp. BT635]|uniref:Uncharacterized protein n=1 Tax=Hymenobacter nitidus TaxID=2880929 RepID=A0ABS8A9R7_9BACT|nr:hypothetical protein [Hymenobacter nitidus]MCB2376964.1 hypothetical protein [Hymenobacter nitidus]
MTFESTSCFDLLHDAAHAERQLADALHTVAVFRDYHKLLERFQQLDPADRANCPDLAVAATDRAFDVELKGRVMIKHGLDALNSLRDGGQLYQEVEKAAKVLAQGDIRALLEKEGDRAREKYGPAAADLFTEALTALEKLDMTFSVQDEHMLIHRKSVDGASEQVSVATTRQAGQLGRVSAGEFFGGWDGKSFITPGRLYTPRDCHHRPELVTIKDRLPVDIYAGAVSGLAMTKNLLYQHARRVSELGPRGLRGEDPVTAILVGIALVGLAIAIYGVATGNGFLVVFGAILIVGSALVAFGGYTLVLALLV